ncbi:MAG: winged helix DNA-binding domain-containing protein [Acidimicrobiia bacterium]
MVRRIGDDERRARVVARHHHNRTAGSVEDASESLVGFHSSDPVSVFLSAWARVEGFAVADLDEALYERRTLLRMLGMRRTLFVQTRRVAAVMDTACTRDLMAAQRRRLAGMIEDQGLARDGEVWLSRVEAATVQALVAAGEATASELRLVVPDLQRKLMFGEGKKWGGEVGISTRVLFLLATSGRIVRGRPLGTWRSSQYRWAPIEVWLDDGLTEIGKESAEVELLERWLRSYGPGTLTDLRWWTGWTVTRTREVLTRLDVEAVELDDGTGFVLAHDLDSPDRQGAVALLPGLDPSVMGWKERGWFLGEHGPALFDRNGNAGPTVWVNGRIVGGWAQSQSGRIVTRLLEDVGVETAEAVEAEADRLEGWLDGFLFKPRFRGPLEKELAESD